MTILHGDIVIIAGSRSYEPPSTLSPHLHKQAIEYIDTLIDLAIKESGYLISCAISGGAIGIDRGGERWAIKNKIKYKVIRPVWKVNGIYNPRGGMQRNSKMADIAEKLICVWDGQSAGSCNMIEEMRMRNKPVYIKVADILKVNIDE